MAYGTQRFIRIANKDVDRKGPVFPNRVNNKVSDSHVLSNNLYPETRSREINLPLFSTVVPAIIYYIIYYNIYYIILYYIL